MLVFHMVHEPRSGTIHPALFQTHLVASGFPSPSSAAESAAEWPFSTAPAAPVASSSFPPEQDRRAHLHTLAPKEISGEVRLTLNNLEKEKTVAQRLFFKNFFYIFKKC